MSRIFKGRTLHSADFKFGVIREYLGCDLSLSAFCKKKSLDRGTFRYWLHTFVPESNLYLAAMGKSNEKSDSEVIRDLKRQLVEQAVELKREKMRADFYETMVDVAEEQFNISIRKKAGAKQ
ncbi:MAG: hypothetical protein LBF17_03730 [Mediterranea sp.]|jgi:transposase-like protein|nr:hypothetical protein [Mediterranea sp.]